MPTTNSLTPSLPTFAPPTLPRVGIGTGGVNAGAWHPPQWQKRPMVLLTVPASSSLTSATLVDGVEVDRSTVTSQAQSYVFDAVLDLEHEQSLTKTVHPVQTNTAINSHAYLNPAAVTMYVLMSDVAGSYSGGVNQTVAPYVQAWTGSSSSKSVDAYQTVLDMQAQRVLLTITTRLRTYNNMLVGRILPREDPKTITAARFRVEFDQVILVDTSPSAISARPNETSSTGLGAVNPSPPSSTVSNQFTVPASSGTNSLFSGAGAVFTPNPLFNSATTNSSFLTSVDVPGAGSYTSKPQQFGAGFGGASGGAGASGVY